MTGKIEDTAGLIANPDGMINQDTGKINDSTGLIESNAGLIDDNSGLITETKTGYTASGRKKRSRERGKDKTQRNFPLHTMKNLPQFRNKSHKEVRQYILETKRGDIGGNVNWNNTVMWILIGLVLVAG